MAQRFYQKASVQVAIVTGVVGLLIAAMHIWFNYSEVKRQNEKWEADNKTLSGDLAKANTEIQRLETLLTPFRTIALERYTGPEQEALNKLAERIRTIENQVKDVEKFKEIAAKHEFTPLDPTLLGATTARLASIRDMFNQNNITISITHESWTPPATRKFASQLSILMKDAGLDVSGPNFASVYLVGEVYPLEWGFNESQTEVVGHLYSALQPVMRCSRAAKRTNFSAGTIRIHFAGQAIFGPSGKVELK